MGLFLEFFIIFKESLCCSYYFILIDAPKIFKIVDDISFFVQRFKNFVVGNIVKTQNTVTDSCRFVNLYPTYLTCIVTVSSAASLNIDSFDVHNSDSVAGNNTSLIEVESMLRFSFFLTLEIFADRMAFQNDSVGLVLNLHFFFFGN